MQRREQATGPCPGLASPPALPECPLPEESSGADRRCRCWKPSGPRRERGRSPQGLYPPHGDGPLPPGSSPSPLQTVSRSYCYSWERPLQWTGCWARRCRMTGPRSKADPPGPRPWPPGGQGQTGWGGGPGDAFPSSLGACLRSFSPSSCSGWVTRAWSAVWVSPRQTVYPDPWLHEDPRSRSAKDTASPGDSRDS